VTDVHIPPVLVVPELDVTVDHVVVEQATRPSALPTLVDARTRFRRRGAHVPRTPRWVRKLTGPVVVVGLWAFVCASGLVNEQALASPGAVLDAGQELWDTGELQRNLLISLQRVGLGLLFGVAAGLLLALAAGLSRRGDDLLDPSVQMLRAVPILGLIPLVIIWFGVGETSKVFLIALGVTFPVYLNTHAAIRGVDARLVEAGETFGLGRFGLVGRVILPGALPGFLVGLRFALVGGWLIIIVAEQINAQSGLGYLINQAQSWSRTDIIVLGLVIYSVLGLVADSIVRLLERRLLAWRVGFTGA
jgi:sulfonate transport system permease protein